MLENSAIDTRDSWAVICGAYINAYSIVETLEEIGCQGHIVCLKDRHDGTVLAELFGRRVQVWQITLKSPEDVIEILAKRIPPEAPKIVFFTDERFHPAFRDELSDPRLENTRFFLGSAKHLDTILDRYAFYQFIERRTLAEVPRTIAGTADPWSTFPGKFFLRPKRSWRGLMKLSRVKLISATSQWRETISVWRQQGLDENDWCYQEVLSVSNRHNVSISGWHDPQHHSYVATRKVFQHPAKTGNGDVCEIIEPPAGLLATTKGLLDALQYAGPFELEFVLDKNSGSYKVIELNPRFWMQHALVGAVTGQDPVRRYVGLPVDRCAKRSPCPTHWVNTIYAVFRLLRADVRILRYLGKRTTVHVPSRAVTLRWLLRLVPSLARKMFR